MLVTTDEEAGDVARADAPPVEKLSYGEIASLALARAAAYEAEEAEAVRTSIRDHMYALHCSWQGIQLLVRKQTTVNKATGKYDPVPLKLAVLDHITDCMVLLSVIDAAPPVMTHVQASNVRRQGKTSS